MDERRTQFLIAVLTILFCFTAVQAQNLVQNGSFDDDSAWEITYYNTDFQPEYDFNYTDETPKFGRDGCLHIYQGESGGQLLLWQTITLIAGQTYRVTGAISLLEMYMGPEGGGNWYQMYISTEIPDETAGDYNPTADKIFDVGEGWDRTSGEFDAPWESVNISAAIPSVPYYTPEGTAGEEVEVIFGIKFGQYWGDYAGTGFELLVDEVGLFPVASAINMGGGMDADAESAWEITYYNTDFQPEYAFNYTDMGPRLGSGPCLDILQGESGGQLLLWQTVDLVAGETYRMTGAIANPEWYPGPEGGGNWYQMYISPELPDETAGDYNPLDDKIFDVGEGWDRTSGDFDDLFEAVNLSTVIPSVPYYTPEGTAGEVVEELFGIKFGQYWGDYAGTGFELVVDEVYIFPLTEAGMTTGSAVKSEAVEAPSAFALHANYPNPFNPSTTIQFDLAGEDQVTLSVYDLQGHQVSTLLNQKMAPGSHQVQWNATNDSGQNVSSGVYLIRLKAGQQESTRKITLLR